MLNKLSRLLEQAGISLTDHQKNQLVAYVDMLNKWNKAYNLTSVRDPNEMLIRHILDSIVVAPYLNGERFIDVGTGPGFFAIILARMGYQVTAVDYTASMLEEARRNAGALADKIDFHQMNAEELMFADYSFDVLVTRNVTWNLHDPEKAYSHWTRVLAPGGLLLNFDANWYRYLWDEEAELGHKRDRENLAVSDVRDENAGTDVDAMEAIARKTPLSRQHRPQWDLRVLSRFGIQASADENIWQRVWTKEERINNASTPMFLIEGRKAGLLES